MRGELVVLVTHCVRSIVETSTYDNYEIVCVVDDRTDAGRARRACGASAATGCGSCRTPGPFNFSDKINTGVLASEGEHVLLLNDDIEVVTPDWLERTGHVLAAARASAPSGPSCCSATAACSTSA